MQQPLLTKKLSPKWLTFIVVRRYYAERTPAVFLVVDLAWYNKEHLGKRWPDLATGAIGARPFTGQPTALLIGSEACSWEGVHAR